MLPKFEKIIAELIKNKVSQREIQKIVEKNHDLKVHRSTIQRIAKKFNLIFTNKLGVGLTSDQKKFVIRSMISGKTVNECKIKFREKYKRNIHRDTISKVANDKNIKTNKASTDNYSLAEKSVLKGLWLIGTPTWKMTEELKTRGIESMSAKLRRMKMTREISDVLKSEIKDKLESGENFNDLAKQYGIDSKYIKAFSKNVDGDTVEMTNLKKWEDKDVNDILDLMEKAQKTLRNLESEQKEANINIKTKSKYIAISFPSDFHLENVNTDLAQLRKDFQIIRDTPNFYMGFGGDLADNFLVGVHKEGAMESVVPPKASRIAAGKLFDSIRGKVLYTILGCHDSWDKTFAGYDLCEHIARKLGVPYLGHGGDVNLRINNVEYFLHCRHKYSGGSKINGTGCCKNILRDINPKYDIVVVSHNHISEIKLEHFLGKIRCYVRSGSYKIEDAYSKMLGYTQNEFNQQIPVVILNAETKEMKIVSGIKSASELLRALNR